MNSLLRVIFGIVFFYIYLFILFRIIFWPLEKLIDFNNGYFYFMYLNVWLNLYHELINFEFLSLKQFWKELPYLFFVLLHYFIYKIIQTTIRGNQKSINKIFKFIFHIPMKCFQTIDKLFPPNK